MRVNYEEWKKRKSAMFQRMVDLENSFEGRAPGRRPRDPEKERLLAEMDRKRFQRALDSGKIEILGPRKWRYNIKPPEEGGG